MASRFTKRGRGRRALGGALGALGVFALVLSAQTPRTVKDGVYGEDQATRGQTTYKEQCAMCHGDSLGGGLGPPLSGDQFLAARDQQTLADLVSKIQSTMPASDPGKLTRAQAIDLAAFILRSGKFPAGKPLGADEAELKQIGWPPAPKATTVAAGSALTDLPLGNMAQVMRGILFPSSNLIFNVQNADPAAPKKAGEAGAFSWADWGAGIYSGWEMVDYASVALAEAAPLLLTPGRRCENGRPVPVTRPDWVKYAQELVEAGRAAYKASQTRKQDAMIDVSGQIADACLHCHEVYRDKPGGTPADPSNKAARCVP
jgi:mono/diheme cytochrome c family protein